MSMGASLVADGATFRVWAPNASAVHVRGDFNNFEIRDDAALVSHGNGHWRGFISGVQDRQRYKFWIDGQAGPGYKREPYAREPSTDCSNCIGRDPAVSLPRNGFVSPPVSGFFH